MRRTTPDQVLLEVGHTLSAEAAKEIKDAWEAWQAVARRYDVKVRPLEGTLIIPDHDVTPRKAERWSAVCRRLDGCAKESSRA